MSVAISISAPFHLPMEQRIGPCIKCSRSNIGEKRVDVSGEMDVRIKADISQIAVGMRPTARPRTRQSAIAWTWRRHLAPGQFLKASQFRPTNNSQQSG